MMNCLVPVIAAVQSFCNPLSIPDTPISHECWKLKHGDIVEKDKLPAWSYSSWQYEEDGVKKVRQFREIGEPEELVCDYREAQVVRADAVRLVLVGSPKGLTAAVTEFTAFGVSL